MPRRLDEERPHPPGPTVEPVADVREFSLAPRRFTSRCAGLFLFVADLVRLVSFHRRAHLPIILASDLVGKPIAVPWWSRLPLRLTTYTGPAK